MQRRYRFHPGPLTILVAIVLCLMASFAFGQVRRVAPGAATGARSPTTALPAPSGLTSGTAPGLVNGTPAASGLTSGSSPTLPPSSPAASGLTSGTTGGTTTGSTTPDTTTTVTGGSTRGVVVVPVIPLDSGAGTTVTTTTGTTGATGTTSTTTTPGTTTGTTAGTTGAAVVSGFAGVTNGVPSVAPSRSQTLQTMGGGPLTSLQISQLFAQADADNDGLLTRAEALRLPLVTMSFDDMDTNRDGVVSRSEYDASLR